MTSATSGRVQSPFPRRDHAGEVDAASHCFGRCRARLALRAGEPAQRSADRTSRGDLTMRLDQLPRSENVEDRRGQGGGFRVPGGRGGLGIGTVVVLGLLAWALGVDPRVLIDGAEIFSGGDRSKQQSSEQTRAGAPSDQAGQFVSAVLGSTEAQWQKIFAQAGKEYEAPTLVMFSGATRSACGFAQSAMGPFYCPNDRKVYLDTSFFQDLERRFRACDAGSKSCQFSQAYVIAHEVGHHVQNLLGILPKVQRMQQSMDRSDSN